MFHLRQSDKKGKIWRKRRGMMGSWLRGPCFAGYKVSTMDAKVYFTANCESIDQIRRILAFDICLVLELYKQTWSAYHTRLGIVQPKFGHSEVCRDSPPFPTANHSIFECLVSSTTKQTSKARMRLIWSIVSQLAVMNWWLQSICSV